MSGGAGPAPRPVLRHAKTRHGVAVEEVSEEVGYAFIGGIGLGCEFASAFTEHVGFFVVGLALVAFSIIGETWRRGRVAKAQSNGRPK